LLIIGFAGFPLFCECALWEWDDLKLVGDGSALSKKTRFSFPSKTVCDETKSLWAYKKLSLHSIYLFHLSQWKIFCALGLIFQIGVTERQQIQSRATQIDACQNSVNIGLSRIFFQVL
jgi:hypothetical protein